MKKKEIIKKLNIAEPIILLLFEISLICSMIYAFNHLFSEDSWYEYLIGYIILLLPVVIIIFEIYIFFNIKDEYKVYTFFYFIIDLGISYFLIFKTSFLLTVLAGFVSLFLFNLAKCVYRIKKLSKIIRK